MKLNIERVSNGYVCTWTEDTEGDTAMTCWKNVSAVFEEADTETGELDCAVNMLYFVKEHFGIYYSKHNKRNIEIKAVKNKEVA